VRIVLISVGRPGDKLCSDLTERYLTRAEPLARALGIQAVTTRILDDRRGAPGQEAFGKASAASALTIALDERGRTVTSKDFAGLIDTARLEALDCVIMIGGAEGLPKAVRAEATHQVAFGAATWPHELVRAMAAEQIYRALTILAGHPYHREG
jgi:23S rRNA (pseudouridine1915-N3)-methyltransferase